MIFTLLKALFINKADAPDAFDHVANDVLDHDVSATPVVHTDAPRRSSRVSKPPSYLKAYHCNQVS